jgi:cell wall-associated NlpC family hydrolase
MIYQNKLLPQILVVFLIFLFAFSSCKSRKIITDSSKNVKAKTTGNLKDRYALMLGVSREKLQNEKLYRFIDNWMGVPHRTGGMDQTGIDCSGFTSILENEIFNRQVPRIARQIADQIKRKYEDELLEGDLVFFDFEGQRFSHVGVYLHNNKFVHASTSRGVIISDLKDPWYYKYFSRAGSIEP